MGAFKFMGAFNSWSEGNYGTGVINDDGLSGTLIDDGASGNVLATPGFYKAEVNMAEMTYKLTPITSIGLIGPAQAGGWDTDTDLTYNPETRAFEGILELAADEFLFRANDGWDISWGGTFNNLTQKGASLKIEEAGTYFVQFYPLCETKSYVNITSEFDPSWWHLKIGEMFESDGIKYRVVNLEEVEVVGLATDMSTISIPEIVHYNIISYKVTTIGNSAFRGTEKLFSITLSNTITTIGEYAFSGCSSLTSITIPNSVTTIEEKAFEGCHSLTSVIIGSGVTFIGYEAFGNTKIKKAIWLCNTPPSGYSNASGAVNYVSNDQFSFNNQIKYQFLSSYFEVGGIRYVPVIPSERTCDAIDCVSDESNANMEIASTVVYKGVTMNVKNIQPYFAYNNKYIKTLYVNCDGKLPDNAFRGCSNIKSVALGNKVLAIGSYAFQGCSSIETIDIPDIVTTLNDYTFSDCTSLKEIRIKAKIKNINNYVFNNCTSIKKVIIENGDESLIMGSNGNKPIFSSCPLDYVYIGRDINYNSSRDCGYSPFYRNTTLRAVKIADKEMEISENEFYGCTNLQRVIIGDGVTTIGNWAFSGCSSLKYFAFGSQVKNVGHEAFSDCTAVSEIISMAQIAPICGDQALDDINKWECRLFVPSGCMAAYESADQWKSFFFKEEGTGTNWLNDIGDVNGDGIVDYVDINEIVNYIMNCPSENFKIEAADVNHDDKVNVADIVEIVNSLK
jgi:hypothetical protein